MAAKARRWWLRTSRACTDMRWLPARRRPRSAPTATARTRFSTPGTRSLPSSSSTCRSTCGKCHEPISKEFQQSIHGQAIAAATGRRRSAPIAMAFTPSSRTSIPILRCRRRTSAQVTCARCHEGVRLSQEFGVEGRRETTYLASYHGLASRGGSQVVANCASCHGMHNIFPSSDPRSTINRANLARTCGQCHPGVTEKFTPPKFTWMRRSPPTSAARRCAGFAAFISA